MLDGAFVLLGYLRLCIAEVFINRGTLIVLQTFDRGIHTRGRSCQCDKVWYLYTYILTPAAPILNLDRLVGYGSYLLVMGPIPCVVLITVSSGCSLGIFSSPPVQTGWALV